MYLIQFHLTLCVFYSFLSPNRVFELSKKYTAMKANSKKYKPSKVKFINVISFLVVESKEEVFGRELES